jgi:hypothetical protein
MRKVVVTTLMSLDGYVAGPGGDVMVLPLDESFSAYNVERMREADTILLGRTTYEGFRDYWPRVVDDESQPEIEREISSINNSIEKVVVSDTLTEADTGPWADTTRIVKRAEAHEVVRERTGWTPRFPLRTPGPCSLNTRIPSTGELFRNSCLPGRKALAGTE